MCELNIPNASSATTKVGDTAIVNCDTGYTVNGNNPITCDTDNTFSNIPTCEPDCTTDNWQALDIEHSVTPANLPVPYQTVVAVQCTEKYSTMTNSEVNLKCGANGQFVYTGGKPTCYPGEVFSLV